MVKKRAEGGENREEEEDERGREITGKGKTDLLIGTECGLCLLSGLCTNHIHEIHARTPDEIGDKEIDGIVIYLRRLAYLLQLTETHDCDTVAH